MAVVERPAPPPMATARTAAAIVAELIADPWRSGACLFCGTARDAAHATGCPVARAHGGRLHLLDHVAERPFASGPAGTVLRAWVCADCPGVWFTIAGVLVPRTPAPPRIPPGRGAARDASATSSRPGPFAISRAGAVWHRTDAHGPTTTSDLIVAVCGRGLDTPRWADAIPVGARVCARCRDLAG